MATDTVNHDDDPSIDQIYEQVLNCEFVIPPEDVDRMADMVFSKEKVIRQWRLTALLASKDGAFYRELSENEDQAKTFAPMVEVLNDFARTLRGMADLAECAAMRITVAGCNHEEFNTWMKEEA